MITTSSTKLNPDWVIRYEDFPQLCHVDIHARLLARKARYTEIGDKHQGIRLEPDSKRLADVPGYLIQLFTRWSLFVIWRQFQPEAIVGIPREYMQVNMKHFLSSGHAIREKEVHSVTLRTTLSQCCSDALSNAKHLRTFLFLQVCEICGVPFRNN